MGAIRIDDRRQRCYTGEPACDDTHDGRITAPRGSEKSRPLSRLSLEKRSVQNVSIVVIIPAGKACHQPAYL